MRTNVCKNWRCRFYDTKMTMNCARAISETDDRPYALICNAYMPKLRGMVSLGHMGWVTLAIGIWFGFWTAFGWMSSNDLMGVISGCLLQWAVCAISFRRFG